MIVHLLPTISWNRIPWGFDPAAGIEVGGWLAMVEVRSRRGGSRSGVGRPWSRFDPAAGIELAAIGHDAEAAAALEPHAAMAHRERLAIALHGPEAAPLVKPTGDRPAAPTSPSWSTSAPRPGPPASGSR